MAATGGKGGGRGGLLRDVVEKRGRGPREGSPTRPDFTPGVCRVVEDEGPAPEEEGPAAADGPAAVDGPAAKFAPVPSGPAEVGAAAGVGAAGGGV